MMQAPRWPLAILVAATTALAACGSTSNTPMAPVGASNTYGNAYGTMSGRVQDIQVVPAEQRGAGAGAVIGAVIGGLVGNQIGSGSGRAAATGVGVVGGAIAGHQIQKRNAGDVYRVSVRFDNGERRNFDYQQIGDLRIGDRVRLEGGELHMG